MILFMLFAATTINYLDRQILSILKMCIRDSSTATLAEVEKVMKGGTARVDR